MRRVTQCDGDKTIKGQAEQPTLAAHDNDKSMYAMVLNIERFYCVGNDLWGCAVFAVIMLTMLVHSNSSWKLHDCTSQSQVLTGFSEHVRIVEV